MDPVPAPPRPAPARTPEDLDRMSLFDHLEELRSRVFWALLGFVAAFVPCWIYVQEIFDFLEKPITKLLPVGKRLAYTGITDPFILYFKVAGLAALFLAAPFLLFQVWRFVSPGLYKHERLYVIPFLFFGSFFFVSGGAFAYYVAFPYAAQFLLGMGTHFEPVITIERYFGFLLTVILGLGLMFELPILIFLLCIMGVVTPWFLMRNFRWAVVIIFIVSAIITPTPDIINLCIFAVPSLFLYLLGVGTAAVVLRNKKRRAAAEDSE